MDTKKHSVRWWHLVTALWFAVATLHLSASPALDESRSVQAHYAVQLESPHAPSFLNAEPSSQVTGEEVKGVSSDFQKRDFLAPHSGYDIAARPTWPDMSRLNHYHRLISYQYFLSSLRHSA